MCRASRAAADVSEAVCRDEKRRLQPGCLHVHRHDEGVPGLWQQFVVGARLLAADEEQGSALHPSSAALDQLSMENNSYLSAERIVVARNAQSLHYDLHKALIAYAIS